MRSFVAALLLAAAPLAALAQPDASSPPAAPAAAPQWSLGAGVLTFAGSTSGVLFITSTAFVTPPTVPVAQATLERSLGDDTWLVAGVFGAVDRQRAEVPAGASGRTRYNQAMLGLRAGVRRLLTPRGSPVDVSLLLTGNAGVGHSREDLTFTADSVRRQTTWGVGASAGIAVDRELVSNLSLRVATSLVGAGYTWGRTELSDSGSGDGSAFSAGFQLAPSLELRLAF
jgi:hypothetical protein